MSCAAACTSCRQRKAGPGGESTGAETRVLVLGHHLAFASLQCLLVTLMQTEKALHALCSSCSREEARLMHLPYSPSFDTRLSGSSSPSPTLPIWQKMVCRQLSPFPLVLAAAASSAATDPVAK